MQVGITVQKLQHPDYAEEGHYLNVRWQKFADAIGVTLIPIATTKLAKQMIDKRYIKAIILSGGGSLSKEFPKRNLNNTVINNIDLNREEIEKTLIEFSLESNMPIIGVCRGMQALGMFFGGKLSKVNDHVNTRHTLSYYCPILESNINRTVNSYHNYSIKMHSIPDCFQANIDCMNAVEQMTHDNNKMLGIMWHPERETKFSDLDIKLFRKFLGL